MPLLFSDWTQTVEEAITWPGAFERWTVAVPRIVPRNYPGETYDSGVSGYLTSFCTARIRHIIYTALDRVSLCRLRAVGDFGHERLIEVSQQISAEPEPDPGQSPVYLTIFR